MIARHPVQEEELMAYLDGELALDRAATAAAHLEKCRECQSVAGDLQSVSRKLMAWRVESPDDLRMTEAIAVVLEERGRAKEKPAARRGLGWREGLRIPRLPRWVWVGGIAVASLAILVFMSNSFFPVYESKQTPRPMTTAVLEAPAAPATTDSSAELRAGSGTGKLDTQQDKAKVSVITKSGTHSLHAEFGASEIPNRPMIVRTAGLTLITKEFDKARAAMEEILKRHGGYIGQLNVTAPADNGRTLNATLRVPGEQLEAVMSELKKLGRVQAESQSGEEVTQQYMDLEARLANAKNSERRLTDILRERTGKLSDVLEVETQIESVRGEIEQMEAERKNLVHRVDFATLSATLTEEYEGQLHAVPVSTFTRIRNSAVDGYSMLSETVVSVVLFLFSYGPVLLLWAAVLFFPVRFVWRKLRRKVPCRNLM